MIVRDLTKRFGATLVLNLLSTKSADAYSYYGNGHAPQSPRKRAKERERAGS